MRAHILLCMVLWGACNGHTLLDRISHIDTSVASNSTPTARRRLTEGEEGVTWVEVSSSNAWTDRAGHAYLVFHDFMWIIGGFLGSTESNDVWFSGDGVSWTEATSAAAWSARYAFAATVFQGHMWVLGGQSSVSVRNDVWFSPDGFSWTEATSSAEWEARYDLQAVAYNELLWVTGGLNNVGDAKNDVWSSYDGTNWTMVTSSAAFSGRYGFGFLVHDNLMYVFCGDSHNDIWKSADGFTWELVNLNIFGGISRADFAYASIDDRIWIMGGYSNFTDKNDVWSSRDGVIWTQVTPSAEWAGRSWHSAVTYNNKLWITGGIGSAIYDDVYSSEFFVNRTHNVIVCSGDKNAIALPPNKVDKNFPCFNMLCALRDNRDPFVSSSSALYIFNDKNHVVDERDYSEWLDLNIPYAFCEDFVSLIEENKSVHGAYFNDTVNRVTYVYNNNVFSWESYSGLTEGSEAYIESTRAVSYFEAWSARNKV